MNPDEIRAALDRSAALPHGRIRTEHLETLAAEAKSGSDRRLEGQVLLALVQAYSYAGERDLAPVAYGRLLHIYDEFPVELGPLTSSIHWYLKWMTWGLIDNPAIPLPTVHRWLDELENRYRLRGYSLRPVFALRAELARETGDADSARALLDASMAAPRDGMSDCGACERNEWGRTSAYFGDDEAALTHWQPVLDSERTCVEEPHRVFAQALLPLVRTGRLADARNAHLTGYQLVRHAPDLRHSVGMHIEFCALTGNEARGLEILAAHAGWLTDPGSDVAHRLSFVTGVCVLLRRLTVLGLGELSIGTGSANSLLAELDSEIAELCTRYDLRNGNTVVSTRIAGRLARQPLVDQLPLGLGATFVKRTHGSAVPAFADAITERGTVITRSGGPAASTESADSAVAPDSDAADRAAEARRLAELGTAQLSDDPSSAEALLRHALSLGAPVLPAEHTARMSAQLVIAIAGQPGNELKLADAALRAAARWEEISVADAVHHTLIAARALHRAERHGEAVALFEQALAGTEIPYPDVELAVVRGQFGESLRALRRDREAIEQFALGAGLVPSDSDRGVLRAELARSAAAALSACGEDERALAAYLHAAEMFGRAGRALDRVRCLRAAARTQRWLGAPEAGGRPWLDTMAAVLAELTELAAGDTAPEVTAELADARDQLAEMRRREGTGRAD
ncbi:hypothetical protein [Nocardia arthritidis]|uniref:Tetratricopeptide repeat protein n=1 Tax=Nocardia arthritidis TaxID=228602 RepID=A0A6G9YAG3_9NOCA|nr:hypothetical protein [Nocardia arthritidis]QIS10255.1 hypothetical protein F5544_11815 [Nocardia arthritidis]